MTRPDQITWQDGRTGGQQKYKHQLDTNFTQHQLHFNFLSLFLCTLKHQRQTKFSFQRKQNKKERIKPTLSCKCKCRYQAEKNLLVQVSPFQPSYLLPFSLMYKISRKAQSKAKAIFQFTCLGQNNLFLWLPSKPPNTVTTELETLKYMVQQHYVTLHGIKAKI